MAVSMDKWAPACAAVLEDWLSLVKRFVAENPQNSVDVAESIESLADD